jgi:hypothetical protein
VKEINYENIAKRMIALNYLGGIIVHYDGHRGLWWYDTPHFDMNAEAAEHKVKLPRSKRYDGILSILDCVDEFLPKVGFGTLLEFFDSLDEGREEEGGVILEYVSKEYL